MRNALRKVVIIVGLLMALGIADKAVCLNAEASFGANDALMTMGVATGIGTVIGLSTIAFYESPTSHLKNALMGAGAGLIVGLGVTAYLLASSAQDDEISPEELLPPENKPTDPGKKPDSGKSEKKKSSSISVPATFAMLDHSNWVVGLRVLELRF